MKIPHKVFPICFIFLFFFPTYLYSDLPGWNSKIDITITNSSAGALTDHQVLVDLNTQDLIGVGADDMQADGDDIRFLDSDDATQLDYWIEEGMGTTSTKIWVEIPSVPVGAKTIYLYYGNQSATAVSSLEDTMIPGEVGEVSADENYTTVNLTNTYTSPVIVSTPVENAEDDEISTRIRNVAANSFDIRSHNPSENGFTANTIYYLVVEEGQFETTDGVLVEAHTYNETRSIGRSGGGSFSTLTFSHSYSSAPVVFSQVMSINDTDWITETLRNGNQNTIQSSMERAEVSSSAHGAETMGWIALETDQIGSINGIPYETLTSGDIVTGYTQGGISTDFSQTFSSAPLVISDQRKRDGNNGGWVTIKSVTTSNFTQYVDEDQVGDSERSHTTEDTSIIAFGFADQLAFRKFSDPQPTVDIILPIDKLVFTTATQEVFEDQVSSVITIQTQDKLGNPTNVTSDSVVSLSSTSINGEFSLSDSPFTPLLTLEVTISAGSNSASFYYRDGSVGVQTITATPPATETWDSDTYQITIKEVVQVGAYKVPITITNGCGAVVSDQQVLVDIDTATPIADNKMESDGRDIRFLDEDDSTQLSYWIESGINTASTRIWVKIPSIPSAGKTIYLYYGSSSLAAASSIENTMILGEVGQVSIDENYTTVNFANTYSSAVVVATQMENTDDEEASVRVKNVGAGSFDMRQHNPSGNSFATSTVYYLVIEEGQLESLDGVLLEAHTYNESRTASGIGGDSFTTLNFDHTYSAGPVVLSQIMSENDASWVTETIRNVGNNSAQSSMELAEVFSSRATAETMGWIAIETAQTGSMNSIPYETATSGDNVLGHDNGVYSTSFAQTFSSAPLVISDQRKRDGGNGGWVTIDSVTTSALNQYIDEDQVRDGERNHTTEDTSFIALQSAGQLAFSNFACSAGVSSSDGAEEISITQIAFTTSEQTIIQNQVSSVMTIQTQDVNGSSIDVSSDTTIDLSSSSSNGEFSDSATFVSTIDQVTISTGTSEAEFYYRDSDVGTPSITASENPAQGWSDATQDVTILSSVNSFLISVPIANVTGAEFTMTITALDENSAIATTYNQPATLTVNYILPASGTGALSVTSVTNFIDGVATITNQSFSNCGTISLTAAKSDDPDKTGTSTNITFAPTDFTVEATNLDESSSHTINEFFTLTVTALDAAGSICAGYQGPASLSVNYIDPSTDQIATVSPENFEGDNWVAGVAQTTEATYDKYGQVEIVATDDNTTAQQGTSEEIIFYPKDFQVVLSDPLPSRDFYYINENFEVTVIARDQDDETVLNYQGTISFTAEGLVLPEDYTFISEDLGIAAFDSINSTIDSENQIIAVTDTDNDNIIGVSDLFSVKDVKIQAFSNQGPVGNLALTVAVVDKDGVIINQDDATFFIVTLEEFIEDNSATSATETIPMTMTEGRATIIINDDQAESVTITPSSTPELEPVSGIATFGTISGTGLGVQIYRELKEKSFENNP